MISNLEDQYVSVDCNGNVVQVIDDDGAMQEQYEYGTFGEVVVSSGTYASSNPYCFSTKYIDDEVIDESDGSSWGCYYYGYRFYDPDLGRWLNRDPIGERGGVNLYAFVGNDGVNGWDYLGLQIETDNCIDLYLSSKGIDLGEVAKSDVSNIKKYLYKGRNSSYVPTSLEGLILYRMMLSQKIFKIKSKPIITELKNLNEHIAARVRIVNNTKTKRYRFGAGPRFHENHTTNPVPDYYDDPQGWLNSINNTGSSMACTAATEACFYGGIGQQVGVSGKRRKHNNVWIPGDWGYIFNIPSNRGRNKNWQEGLEGENFIHVGERGGTDIFWGHIETRQTIFTLSEWKTYISNWRSIDRSESGVPSLRDGVDYPTKGLD